MWVWWQENPCLRTLKRRQQIDWDTAVWVGGLEHYFPPRAGLMVLECVDFWLVPWLDEWLGNESACESEQQWVGASLLGHESHPALWVLAKWGSGLDYLLMG